jgi:hypothetical protein
MRKIANVVVLAALFLAVPIASAAQAQQNPKVPQIGEMQRLKLDNYRKDFKIAAQQVEILKVQLAETLHSEKQAHDYFWNYVNQLRTQLNAPESEFDFDANTLRFIPKKKKATSSNGHSSRGKKAANSK